MKSVVQRILDYVYVANVIANETTFTLAQACVPAVYWARDNGKIR